MNDKSIQLIWLISVGQSRVHEQQQQQQQ